MDKDESLYKKCYDSCETCEIQGNNIAHNCKKCDNKLTMEFAVNNYYNCYQNCSYYYYFDNFSNYHCTINGSCPYEYPILKNRECEEHKEMKNLVLDLLNNITKEDETKYYDTIFENLEDLFTSDSYNTFGLDSGKDEVIEIDKVKVVLTSSQNQKININNNMTNINLGECENILRQVYNLSDNDTFYIKMIEVFQEGMKIPKIEYDIYSKGEEGNLKRLDLNLCKDSKVSLSIPVNIVDDLDKLNSSSDYYNDFCYTTTSDSGTDITLNDRKYEFSSKTVCQDDCDFIGYNYTTKKAKCSCETKVSSSSFADMKINENKLTYTKNDII